jgi:hypothetical protein
MEVRELLRLRIRRLEGVAKLAYQVTCCWFSNVVTVSGNLTGINILQVNMSFWNLRWTQ